MSEFHDSKIVKARKAHRCNECGGEIQPGETYVRGAGRYEGDFYSYALCDPCDQAWRWTHREFNPDPEWCHIGDLSTLIQECAERFEQLRVAAYIRRQWINRATGERYAFPIEPQAAPAVSAEMKVSTQADADVDDAATLRDAADVLRRHLPDAVDALAVLDMTADMLDPMPEEDLIVDYEAATYAEALADAAKALEEAIEYQWNGNPRRPNNYRSAATFVRSLPNPYRKADQ